MQPVTQIPKSKAKTAYGLLSEIAAIVTAQPQRLAMRIWRSTPRNPGSIRSFPECGTVGCIGGWTETLKRTRRSSASVLGLEYGQATELFMPYDLLNASNQQTPEHARATVAHIRRFQKKYRTQLLKTKV